MAGQTTFEVQVEREGRWIGEARVAQDKEARARATALLKGRGPYSAVRIVKETERPDGSFTERVIFSELKDASGGMTFQVGSVEEAPFCQTVDDLLAAPARMVMNRLFRRYLDHEVMTPVEVLHNRRALKRLADRDGLLPSAVSRTATAQANAHEGMSSKERAEHLHTLVAQADRRARTVDQRSLPDVSKHGLGPVYRSLKKNAPPGEHDYLAMTALAETLSTMRAWVAKLHTTILLAEPDLEPGAVVLLDQVISDVLGSATAVQDLLGEQPHLAGAIQMLLRLHRGEADAWGKPDDDPLVLLNGLIADGKLPETRAVIEDRVIRQVKGTQPLSRSEPDREQERLNNVLHDSFGTDGVIGGSAMAEALVIRQSRGRGMGNRDLIRVALPELIMAAPSLGHGLELLAAFAGSPMGQSLYDEVETVVAQELAGLARIDQVLEAFGTPKERMERVTRLYYRLAESALSPNDRTALCTRLDTLLSDYLMETKIIEHLSPPDESLRLKAIRLVQFCGAGILTPGKAMAMARDQVTQYLRRPRFVEEFGADIADPEERADAIRAFYAQLAKAGFS